jgi:hypothetical protein
VDKKTCFFGTPPLSVGMEQTIVHCLVSMVGFPLSNVGFRLQNIGFLYLASLQLPSHSKAAPVATFS